MSTFWGKCLETGLRMSVAVLACCSIAMNSYATTSISPFPNAELVESRLEDQASNHELMLGPLKKINNVLSAESEEHVRGTRQIEIHFIPDESRAGVVADFYQQQLDSAGINRFRCVGRECGDSNYWANAVFGERILFGASEEQHYFASEIDSHFVVVYVTRRATGKVYVYTEILTPDNSRTVDADLILKSLQAQGRFVLPQTPGTDLISEIVALMDANKALSIVLVGHSEKNRRFDLGASIRLSEQDASQLRDKLLEQGAAAKRLSSKGVGYLAPDDRYPAARIELIVD